MVIANFNQLPFANGSVPTVITNSTPINIVNYLGPSPSTAEIGRILTIGGSWLNNGVLTNPFIFPIP